MVVELKGYCVGCDRMTSFIPTGFVNYRNGRRAAVGLCGRCGRKVSRIVGKVKEEEKVDQG